MKKTQVLALALGMFLAAIGAINSSPALAEDPFDIEGKKDRIGENGAFEFDELEGKLSLRFYDAVTGKPLSGARVTLRDRTVSTDPSGKAVFAFPRQKREEGYENLLVEKKGYVRTAIKLHVLLDSVFIHRFSISPTLPPGRYRITLDWASRPADLDAHLVKRGRYHISFRDMKKYEDLAWLDRDDTDGEGPETITAARLDPNSHYAYYVHDYSNRGDASFAGFRKSNAHVMVVNDAGLVQAFEVPSGPGRVWKVFEITGGRIVPVSGITDRIE
jgi:hypothetical protein